MSGSSSLSHSARCVCTSSRLKYHGCLCGAEMERRRRGIRPDNCVAENDEAPPWRPIPGDDDNGDL